MPWVIFSHPIKPVCRYPKPTSQRTQLASNYERIIDAELREAGFSVSPGHGHRFPSGWRYYDFYVECKTASGRRLCALLEVDGEQHFRYSFGRDRAAGQLRDIHKTRWAFYYGIPLLRIHYKDVGVVSVVDGLRQLLVSGGSLALSRGSGYTYLIRGLKSSSRQ